MTEGLLYLVMRDALWSAIAALGFAVLFNVPPRALPGCMIGGAAGHVVRTLLVIGLGMHIGLATLVGATVIGFVGIWAAQLWKMPTTIFTISSSIPMVPGVFAYRTMLGILAIADLQATDDLTPLIETATNAINTALVLGAIAVGIIAPKLIFLRVKPVV